MRTRLPESAVRRESNAAQQALDHSGNDMEYLAARLGNRKLIAPMRSVYLERRTGILEIDGPESPKRLYFVDGELHLRRSDLRLTKKISALLERTAGEQTGVEDSTGKRNTGVRTIEGHPDLQALVRLIGEHWTAWDATSYCFIKGLDLSAADLVGPLPTARLLIAAAQAAYTEEEIAEQLGGIDGLVVAVPDLLPSDASSIARSDEAILLELCREPVTLGEVMGRVEADGRRSLETLARLWVTGLLRPYTPGEPRDESVVPSRDARLEVESPKSDAADSHARLIWQGHFRLSGDPFSLTPDPSFLFLSESHSEALAALEMGLLERRGLTVLTGEVGTGKTTLLYSLLSSIGSEVETAFIANTTLSLDEILQSALEDLGVEAVSDCRLDRLEALNRFLFASGEKGKTVALIVDEAHALSVETFEGLRQLLNFETYDTKLLQIVLVGQPELGVRLRERELRQVADRIAVRCHLEPLKPGEARKYIEHRLEAAGAVTPVFNRRAINLIIRESRRIPRSINVLCHNAMLSAFASNSTTVTRSAAKEAVRERRGARSSRFSMGRALGGGLIGLILILTATGGWRSLTESEGGAAATATVAPEVPAPPAESIGWPSAQPMERSSALSAERTEERASSVRITTANLNLRAEPSLAAPVLMTLSEGSEVVLLTDEGEWAIVRSGDRSGWVKTSYLAQPLKSASGRTGS